MLAQGAWADGGQEAQGAKKEKEAEAIPWEEAKKHVGEMVTIEGLVSRTERKSGGVFLHFHPRSPDNFQVVIPGTVLAKFKLDPVIYYERRRVRVTGKVEEVWKNPAGILYQGSPFIQLDDPKKIKVVRKKSETPT